jgi:hypothetical protein
MCIIVVLLVLVVALFISANYWIDRAKELEAEVKQLRLEINYWYNIAMEWERGKEQEEMPDV